LVCTSSSYDENKKEDKMVEILPVVEEDKTIYKTTRVVEENGFIVVYRKKKYPNGKFASRKNIYPTYANDVVEYTNAYDSIQKSSYISFSSYYHIDFSAKSI